MLPLNDPLGKAWSFMPQGVSETCAARLRSPEIHGWDFR
jgi:hypothetical protein